MRFHVVASIAAAAFLAGCSEAEAPPTNAAEPANTTVTEPAFGALEDEGPAEEAPAADLPAGTPATRDWLVGTWSFDDYCGSSDFAVSFNADGSLDNSGHLGRWEMDGNTVTETITQTFEEGAEAPTALPEPAVNRYTVATIDAKRGVIDFEGRRIPILRC